MAASEQTTDYDVIVVGAGAAGMAATNALAASGLSVMCLEADSRIGGRTHTDSSIFGVPCDLGAHWLHNAHVNPFVEIGKSLGLDMYAAPDMSHSVGLEDEDVLWDEVERIEEQLSDAAAKRQQKLRDTLKELGGHRKGESPETIEPEPDKLAS